MRKFCIILFCCSVICLPVKAYDLDTSVNSEIEQKYDSDKLNKDMGVGTSAAQKQKSSKKAPKTTPTFDNSAPNVSGTVQKTNYQNTNSKTGTKIPSGTQFSVKSSSALSGWSGAGASVTFTSTSAVYKNGLTIPVGTVFKGTVEDSHAGQMTGNGGLIEIKIVSMNYNGKTYNVEGKITKANSKNVLLNKIKGKRQYIAGVEKQVKRGVNIYNRAKNVSAALPNNPLGKVIKPIPVIGGATATAVYSVVSPLVAVFNKGQNIYLPAGTVYEIKLTKDVYVN